MPLKESTRGSDQMNERRLPLYFSDFGSLPGDFDSKSIFETALVEINRIEKNL
jgi:hypothetical protein